MSDEPVEIVELTQDEWDSICQEQLDKLGITVQELKRRHDEKIMSSEEFKVWMLVGSSTLLD